MIVASMIETVIALRLPSRLRCSVLIATPNAATAPPSADRPAGPDQQRQKRDAGRDCRNLGSGWATRRFSPGDSGLWPLFQKRDVIIGGEDQKTKAALPRNRTADRRNQGSWTTL